MNSDAEKGGSRERFLPFYFARRWRVPITAKVGERSAGIGARARFGSALSRPFIPSNMIGDVTGSPSRGLVD